MTKKCSICGEVKDETEFGWRTAGHKIRVARCRICLNTYRRQWRRKNPGRAEEYNRRSVRKQKRQDLSRWQRGYRRRHLKTNYGITIEQYDAMLVAQDGVCAICGLPETAVRRGKLLPLAVDHNRETGKVRARLCGSCNRGIGDFMHDPVRLRKAATYLEYHK